VLADELEHDAGRAAPVVVAEVPVGRPLEQVEALLTVTGPQGHVGEGLEILGVGRLDGGEELVGGAPVAPLDRRQSRLFGQLRRIGKTV
jgi:hypothetical protein